MRLWWPKLLVLAMWLQDVPEVSMDNSSAFILGCVLRQPGHQVIHVSHLMSLAGLVLLRPAAHLSTHVIAWGGGGGGGGGNG